MDVSGTALHLDRAAVAARRDALAARAADLSDERRQLARSVESLLSGWRGAAADEFRAAWTDWRGGADAVVAALLADLDGLDLACADLQCADATSHTSSARLSGRLG